MSVKCCSSVELLIITQFVGNSIHNIELYIDHEHFILQSDYIICLSRGFQCTQTYKRNLKKSFKCTLQHLLFIVLREQQRRREAKERVLKSKRVWGFFTTKTNKTRKKTFQLPFETKRFHFASYLFYPCEYNKNG